MAEKTAFKNLTEGDAVETARQKLNEKVTEYYEKLAQTPQFQNVKEATDSVVEYVEKHPVQSALIALGIGFVLGLLVSRNSD
ncbi:MAG: hypothetical protein CMR00_13000 [[Chlorobium] sp. 445]|nr:MAG: hypothetical protein CMR00_13000 [[Chlorobium] sp. 445]